VFAETQPGPEVVNIALGLIQQANYLLEQQLRQQVQAFLKEGGLRERMTRTRPESGSWER
jgi:four helix bundle suffix protein